jgi:hypothetical protein
MERTSASKPTIELPKDAETRMTEGDGPLKHCVEYRPKVAWGCIDDL